MPILPLLALWLTFLGAPSQDSKAAAELFVRRAPAAGEVQAVIRVRIERGWHLYHDQLGQPDSVGKATKVSFPGEGIEWSAVRFPEPLRFEQPGIGEGGRDTWIWGHEGTITLYAAGRAAEGVDLAAVQARLSGLTCQDDGSCIPWSARPRNSGSGGDAYFDAFPLDLRPPGAEPQTGSAAPGLPALTLPGKFDASASAPSGSGPEATARLYVRREGERLSAAVEIVVAPGWHLYHDELGQPDSVGKPTTLEFAEQGIAWERPVFPEPERLEQPGIGDGGRDTWIWGHGGTFVVRAEGRAEGEVDAGAVRARLSGLTCQDDGSCIPWEAELTSLGRGADELFVAQPGPAAHSGGPAPGSKPAQQSLAAFLWLAVFWGLFTLLMPCTYPMIPITISFFTKQASQRGGKTFSLSIMYGLGIIAVFIVIGVLFGSVIIPFAIHPVTNLIIGIFFVFFSLTLFGAVDLQPPAFLLSAAGKASRTGGYLGVFLMGVTLVVTSFTCTAPFVGSLLAVGASDGDLMRIVLGMGVFGLTMAVPFVLLSMLPGKVSTLPRSGEWMHVLKVFLGFVELAAALKFISNADIKWQWGLLSRELFLLLWFGTFLVAAAFLFGWVRLKGEKEHEIGPMRMVGATTVFLFAIYCLFGATGREMDGIMTAFIPDYSARMVAGEGHAAAGGGGQRKGHALVIDDYAGARDLAVREDKLLLINFTGFV